jgi:hypothetical protein
MATLAHPYPKDGKMQSQIIDNYPRTAYVLSLMAGILMMASGTLALALAMRIGTIIRQAGEIQWRVGALVDRSLIHTSLFSPLIFLGIATFGLLCGIVVLISAVMLKRRPAAHSTWGILIVVFSVLSFFGFGGFFVGAVLGIVGGALALNWRLPTGPLATSNTVKGEMV